MRPISTTAGSTTTGTRRSRKLLPALLPMLVGALVLLAARPPAFAAPQSGGSSRERSGLAEDQALLQRQLARLRQTMEVLAARFEAEGRTHAAKLLREGLAHLGDRATDQGSKTIDELMGGARSSLESGQTVQAVEVQESVVKSLEKLYSILTDRQGLDDLEHSLEALKQIKADLSALADREKDLRQKTADLEAKAAPPERQALEAGIQKAIEAQRELLSKTEARARDSGEMELEAIARELEALAARQETDARVLETWKPDDRTALQSASAPLDRAVEKASAAERLAEAARDLRAAASVARDPSGDLAAAQRDLEASAAREERREKSAPDPASDSRASKALRAGSRALADAPATPAGRESAASTMEDAARELEKAAEAELAAAREARASAKTALDPLSGRKSAAGDVAQRAREALSAADAKPGDAAAEKGSAARKLGDRAGAESQAAGEARRALAAGLDEESTLPKALAASQARAAEDAARLERALGARAEGASKEGSQARQDLSAAAESQKAAAERASQGDAEAAAKSARSAAERLREAILALARARAESAAATPRTEEERALASAQEALAKSVEALEQKAESSDAGSSGSKPGESGSPSAPSGSSSPPNAASSAPSAASPASSASKSAPSAAKSSLSAAKSAMQSAAESLSKGSPSSAANSQRQALENLSRAAEGAAQGAKPSTPEERAQAEQLAKEQEKIRAELLELARRNEKRDAAKPTPSLAQGASSAGKAKQSLDEGDLDQAQSSEGDAERKMREALSQLSQEEEQYQKLRAEELLFKVAEQVKGMLDAHRDVMRETVEIDGARKPGDPATHTQRLRLRKLSKSEDTLAGRAAEVGQAIRAEESLVFAEVLDEANRDLARASRDLGEDGGFQSGDRVQAVQQDVEQGLAWLYQALQNEKERRRQEDSSGGNQSSGQRGRNRLVPDVAELKLLRQLVVEHLDTLEKFKAAHPEIAEGGGVDPMLLEDLGRLATRHQRTSDLFEQFRRRLGLPDPPQEP